MITMNRLARGFVVLSLITGSFGPVAFSQVVQSGKARQVQRVIVDKVMQPQNGGYYDPWMVRATAAAGFNVYVPRYLSYASPELPRIAGWCRGEQIALMIWERGSFVVSEPSSRDDMYVDAEGNSQAILSPNSPDYWRQLSNIILTLVKASVAREALVGVFLDFENYRKGRNSVCYSASFDLRTFNVFCRENRLEPPALAASERKRWLEEQGKLSLYSESQVAYWLAKSVELRRQIDLINPDFQVLIYPALGSPFLERAFVPGLRSDASPPVLADASTYGKRSGTEDDATALERNLSTLVAVKRRLEIIAGSSPLLGGIDPILPGSSPEFVRKSIEAITRLGLGYWVFYEGVEYPATHQEYFRMFRSVNLIATKS